MSEASDPARWRQLSWAAYGNAFLRGHAPFKAWKNHGGFNGITAEFRLPDGSLVARDGFEWLWWLKQGGVQRLSLAMRDDLAELDRYCCPDRQVIVCHYADCDQIWGRFEEKSRAESQADLAGVYFACYFDSPDRFVLAQSQAPTANPPATDWQEVKREVKTRLSRFAALASLARLPLPDGKWLHASGGKAPTLPPTVSLRLAHELLDGLDTLRGRYDNALHPQNDTSPYHHEDPAQLRALSATINELLDTLQCLAGSETRWQLAERR